MEKKINVSIIDKILCKSALFNQTVELVTRIAVALEKQAQAILTLSKQTELHQRALEEMLYAKQSAVAVKAAQGIDLSLPQSKSKEPTKPN